MTNWDEWTTDQKAHREFKRAHNLPASDEEVESDSDESEDEADDDDPMATDAPGSVAGGDEDLAYEASVESNVTDSASGGHKMDFSSSSDRAADSLTSRKLEFIELMQARFIQGLDEFPYHTVDTDDSYDDLDAEDAADEEAYFDSDS